MHVRSTPHTILDLDLMAQSNGFVVRCYGRCVDNLNTLGTYAIATLMMMVMDQTSTVVKSENMDNENHFSWENLEWTRYTLLYPYPCVSIVLPRMPHIRESGCVRHNTSHNRGIQRGEVNNSKDSESMEGLHQFNLSQKHDVLFYEIMSTVEDLDLFPT